MGKIVIDIHQRGPAEFWVRKRGKHEAFATADDALRHARELQAKAGGFDRAVIRDHTGEGEVNA